MTDRALRTSKDLDALSFDRWGLLPVVAQDAVSGAVLMVAWASRDALEQSLSSGQMHYWSRSRNELWRKGATSGNVQVLESLHADCDGDTVLALVRPAGPACHTGEATCFGGASAPGRSHVLSDLWNVLVDRAETVPEGSYTARLLGDENLRIKKLGEETSELVLALVRGDSAGIRQESADLFYHVLAALLASGVTLEDVLDELEARRNRPGQTG
jgi:phosphoribosyl-ATP pyrophosphohydrolase/phosphoribosyl-AMP cyclohydrolase